MMKKLRIGVMGMGYVGLPLAIEFGKNKVPSILLQHGFSDKNDDIFVSKFKCFTLVIYYL